VIQPPTIPCPNDRCRGRVHAANDQWHVRPICDTYFHDDDGMGAMMDIQALVRALHA
jgi:hypothetical protein